MLFVYTTSNNGMGKIVCSTSLVMGIFTPIEFVVYIPIDANFRQLMGVALVRVMGYPVYGIKPFFEAMMTSQIAKFMGPTWGPPGSCRPQMGPMLASWTLVSGLLSMGHPGSKTTGILVSKYERFVHKIAIELVVRKMFAILQAQLFHVHRGPFPKWYFSLQCGVKGISKCPPLFTIHV